VARLPALTSSKLPHDQASAEIDRSVKALVERALGVYRVDGEQLAALAPDVILTQTQCHVCAASEDDVRAALATLSRGKMPQLVSLAPARLGDVWGDIRRVAEAIGARREGDELAVRLANRADILAARARGLDERPRVACIEWIDPPMAAGNWIPELVSMAGGVCLFGEAGEHSPWLEWPELVARDPDVIVVMPCGFDLARTRRELPALARRPEWPRLRAVKAGRVYLTDGNQFFNRPGPRLVESLEILAEVLHPGLRFGHEGHGWQHA
jgi:iron complex transport system substrate-binding protein